MGSRESTPDDRFQTVASFQKAIEEYLRHRESLVLANKASGEATALAQDEACKRVARQDAYARHAKIVGYHQQALDLWSGNEVARSGLGEAHRAYAEFALSAGDFGVAEAQAAELGDDEAARKLKRKISGARETYERRARTARVTRISLAGSVAATIIAIVAGYWYVGAAREDERRRQAAERRQKAETELEKGRGMLRQAESAGKKERAKAEGHLIGAENHLRAALFHDPSLADARSSLMQAAVLHFNMAVDGRNWPQTREKLLLAKFAGLPDQRREELGAHLESRIHEKASVKMVDESTVKVSSLEGREFFRVQVRGTVSNAELALLDPGKPRHLVVGVKGKGEDTGKVMVFGPNGLLVWERQTAEPYPYRGRGVNRMEVLCLLVEDLWQKGRDNIVTVSNDLGSWFPSKVTVFDGSGDVLRTYWHPGNLSLGTTFKSSRDGRYRILVFGSNNALGTEKSPSGEVLYQYVVFCLDPETMSGEAPPRMGSLGKGVEEWYALVKPKGTGIKGIVRHGSAPGNLQRFEVNVGGNRMIFLDENGRFLGQGRGDGSTGPDVYSVPYNK